jgi:hypothetical protein
VNGKRGFNPTERGTNLVHRSDSQAAIEALVKYQITSKLVWDCHQSLIQLARHNRVQLIWVPGHEGTVGDETADQLARTGSEHLFIGPEPTCGISVGVAKKSVRDWTNNNHNKHWQSITGLKQTKGLILGPSARRTKDLLKLNRPIKMGGRTVYRTLSPKRTPFQTEIDG